MTAPLKIFLVAGEESGDRLGGALMRSLIARAGASIEFGGVGGQDMTAQGLRSLFPLGDLAIMGFTGIPANLRRILRRIRETADAVLAAKPDALVIIDSPEFTHRVARRVRARMPSIPIVDYVSPSVWAWRPWRARAMRRYVDHVLALLPFEPDAMRRLEGPPCTFVGHPLSERVNELRPNDSERTRREKNPPVVLVMPGSRTGEIARMFPVFAETIERVRAQAGDMDIVVPTVPRLAPMVSGAISAWPFSARIVVDAAQKNAAFRIARAALVKSGTGTLELALAGVPMVAAYKVPAVEFAVAKVLVRTPSVILANLVLGERVIPEFVQGDCLPEALTAAMLPILHATPERDAQIKAFARLDEIMEIGQAKPSDRAATIVLDLANSGRYTFSPTHKSAPV